MSQPQHGRCVCSHRQTDDSRSAKTLTHRFPLETRIKLLVSKCHARLGKSRFERPKVSQALRATGLRHQSPIKVKDLRQREISHLRQPAVELAVLFQDSCSRAFELFIRACDQIPDCGHRKVIDRDVQARSNLSELRLKVGRNFNGDFHDAYSIRAAALGGIASSNLSGRGRHLAVPLPAPPSIRGLLCAASRTSTLTPALAHSPTS